jgi:hypothetical protein
MQSRYQTSNRADALQIIGRRNATLNLRPVGYYGSGESKIDLIYLD